MGGGLRWAQSHQLSLGRAWAWGGGAAWPLQLISPDDDVLEVLRSKGAFYPTLWLLACAGARGLPASSSAFLYKVPFVTAAVGEPVPLPSQGQRRSLSWPELPGSTGQTGEDALKGCAQFGVRWGGFGV